MTKLGLNTTMEQIENNEKYPELTYEVEIDDYFVKINNETIDAYIAPVWIKTYENNHDLNWTYNYSNLKVIKPPIIPSLYLLRQMIAGNLEPFVIIIKDQGFYPYGPLGILPLHQNFLFHYYFVTQVRRWTVIGYSLLWDRFFEYCKGIILYDFNDDAHNMKLLKNFNHMPYIYINGTDGKKILDDIDNTRVDFKLKQHLNTSVVSYNVIGQLNGTNPNKTVIIDCLYDSWWCQGTADGAIGMAITLAIAKYFIENDITPKYNLKFIGFGGEEHGFCAGSRYYESFHSKEDILYVIDLNQIGFKQDDPKLTLNIIGNNLSLLNDIWKIIKKADYEKRVNSSDDIKPIWLKNGGPSNSQPFAMSRQSCNTLCFLKNSGWKLHHRDGLNHTEGDVLKYFDHEDVNVTGEVILNVVKYLVTEW